MVPCQILCVSVFCILFVAIVIFVVIKLAEQQKRDNEHRWQQVDLDRALREKRQHDNEQLWQQVDEAVNQDGAP